MKKYIVWAKKYNNTDIFDREELKECVFETIKEANEYIEKWEKQCTTEVHYEARRRIMIKCCGEYIVCEAFTNTCSNCESDYNFSGDRLAPREQWGCETGEHWTDCY